MPGPAVERLIRPHLADAGRFASVDPPEVLARRAGVSEDRIVRLNANENPYGPSPAVAEAVASGPLHLYPDPMQRRVRRLSPATSDSTPPASSSAPAAES